MTLSVAEKSYLYDSLASIPSIRPDGRQQHQFRPIEIYTDFLPSSNGSSRIIASDGSECIVSVKAKVVDHTIDDDLLQIEIEISGERDDSLITESCTSLFNKLLKNIDMKKLQLTKKYSFKLFIDVLVISSNSNPVSLISFGIYSSLNCTLLPKLVSNFDDLEVEELPMFHDYDLVKLEVDSPLVFVLGIVQNNIFIDPAANESEVANNGLMISWINGRTIAPMRTFALNDTNTKGFSPKLMQEGIKLVEKYAPDIANALQNI
ncbi:similar to Saccharomyces cerevisiae YDL111C RRP42 Exosome non-catalytic core component [Maudiozyma barnettii]|uniref:Ribosomal RNA-processing protein 42 n=1 Tax=Maudiozyma barnettii TaxID=61262 RepID=A0A8H2VFH7_9SACH|nr:exosome non-catalytic core subunit RRP42 [Kazachstania barnettii]CAB4254511.1 similar to Saccharomyces cerevisiae YDL111C RRP42 Exosome non-catalytic core component [Kazachstania barnettii]CAD1782533.1 similar to Saccharomyces cerevisiae YDL111C RRP42 Exosome non-catalytic core component [Kazachstania barnettii]